MPRKSPPFDIAPLIMQVYRVQLGALTSRLARRGVAIRKACAEVREELNRAAMETLGERGLTKLQVDLRKLIVSYMSSQNSDIIDHGPDVS